MARSLDTRQRLIETAIDLMWREGYSTTSVDDICAACEIGKGSFYHHFDSKLSLTIAALDHQWACMRPQFDAFFSPVIPPLERIARAYASDLAMQVELHAKTGFVCGCPLLTLGVEFGGREPLLKAKVVEVIGHFATYIASALRDAAALGLIPDGDMDALAWQAVSLREGAVTLARMHNDLRFVRAHQQGIERLLGVRLPTITNVPALCFISSSAEPTDR